jgi:protoheme IX farnesyltransferase
VRGEGGGGSPHGAWGGFRAGIFAGGATPGGVYISPRPRPALRVAGGPLPSLMRMPDTAASDPRDALSPAAELGTLALGRDGMTTATQRAGIAAVRMETGGGIRQRLRDYLTLTKPRIISLLLVTTLAPMVIAARGWPGGWVVLWTMLGGYLMAGGANAINMYMDRDIDARMPRTALRPIPSGRMSPAHVLGFGITLGAAAFALLAGVVNLLSALLALAGLLYYVFIYTRWLKRTSPQNIVIGGAAGAFPPLVGWAAVTGEVSLTAVYMFLIVFFWTPPHFWALALVKQKDYGRVGVPMAPNVWGERETLRQMLFYTGVLIVVTLVPVAYGGLGVVYGVVAALLGAWFLRDVLRLVRASSATRPAWTLYRSSLLYLALLFAAMMVDGVVPIGRRGADAEAIILRNPDVAAPSGTATR